MISSHKQIPSISFSWADEGKVSNFIDKLQVKKATGVDKH